ncbi:MAG: 30S ribosome-binding factor RbfA [Alphaproteobacteria bacterium]|nr:30S ribosome-binding factor RbfA [Alphaproteobacteria bacterium]
MTRQTRTLNQRQLRVAALVREGLAELLARGDSDDPALAGVSVTVSEVRMSPDLRHATVFVLPLGGEGTETVLAGLKRQAPSLSGMIGRKLGLRFSPKLVFVRDETFEHAARIEALLRAGHGRG